MHSSKLISAELNRLKEIFKEEIKFSEIRDEKIKFVIENNINIAFKLNYKKYKQCVEQALQINTFQSNDINLLNIEKVLVTIKENNPIVLDNINNNLTYQIVYRNRLLKEVKNQVDLWINHFTFQKYFEKKNFHSSSKSQIKKLLNTLEWLESEFQTNGSDFISKLPKSTAKKLIDSYFKYDFIINIANFLGSGNDGSEQIISSKDDSSQTSNMFGSENLLSIRQGRDISKMLFSQLALNKSKMGKLLFKANLFESKLLEYHYQGMSSSKPTKETKNIKVSKEGPFIICVDTSGSMTGVPEDIAKAFTYLMTNIAVKEKRECIIIDYSSNLYILKISDFKTDSDQLIDFLSRPASGGTDAEKALLESTKYLIKDEFSKADVIVISDSIFTLDNKELLGEVIKAKEKGNKFYLLTVGVTRAFYNGNVFDKTWTFDESKESIKKILDSLK